MSALLPKEHGGEIATTVELIRSIDGEKAQQIANVRNLQAVRNALAEQGLAPLQSTAR